MTRLSPVRRLRRLLAVERFAAPAIVGLALVLAGPFGGDDQRTPTTEVLGALATSVPVLATPDAEARAAAAHALAQRLDPRPTESERPIPADPAALTGYAWPIDEARLTLPFGPSKWGSRFADGVRVHDGIDLASFCGDRIVAAHDGVVLAAGRRYDAYMGWIGDLGPYTARLDAEHLWSTLPIVVVVDDGNGYRSLYAHFGRVVVAAGDRVAAGQLLGYEGMTGRASGCHLHYGLFSPWTLATMGFDPDAAGRMLLPTEMLARVDPLAVLPPLEAAGIKP